MSFDLGKLDRVELRSIWPDEARNFTPWLSENIDRLAEVLGMDLELIDVEASVGDFAVDILARDLGTGYDVVIENQFGSTNHDHLGKIITYAAGFEAGTVVWLSETIREEHREAIEWLNERTDHNTQFFAILVELIRVDDSKPAFNLRPVVFPNEWKRARVSRKERSVSPRAEKYRNYFQVLLDDLRVAHRFTNAKVAQPQSWYTFTSSISGVVYGASFAMGDRVRAEIYIDLGDYDKNKKVFDRLLESKLDVEKQFGEALEWERLDEKRASRVAIYREGSIEDHDKKLADYHEWHIEMLLRFEKVFLPFLKSMQDSHNSVT